MKGSKTGFSTMPFVLVCALVSLLTVQGSAWAEVVFSDDFTGTVIDPAKWEC